MALKMFKRQPREPRTISVRIQRMATHDLLNWVDTTLMEAGRTFDQWRYHNGPMEEFQVALDVLQEITEELSNRVASTRREGVSSSS